MEQINEPETQPLLRATDAYYRAVRITHLHHRDAYMAAWQLTQDIDALHDLTVTELERATVLPEVEDYDLHERWAKERLLMVPLCEGVTRRLEESPCEIKELIQWYRLCFDHIKRATTPTHSAACLEYESDHGECLESSTCPLREAREFSLLPALGEDFSSSLFRMNPARTIDIARARLTAGVNSHLVEDRYAEVLCEHYLASALDAVAQQRAERASLLLRLLKAGALFTK